MPVARIAWTPERINHILKLDAEGHTGVEIARALTTECKLPVTPGQITSLIRRHKPATRTARSPKMANVGKIRNLQELQAGGGIALSAVATQVRRSSGGVASSLQLPTPSPISRFSGLEEFFVDGDKIRDAYTRRVIARLIRKCPNVVHPVYCVEEKCWFIPGIDKTDAPSLRVLKAMLPAGTRILGYHPLGFRKKLKVAA